ncbi:hypothetical protein SAMN05216474_1205 [Lishizhenia tianjinensis]|uniref:MepB protein n=1 Tax=Lishizhenia tianjinensis TaxID=477690 RepID=A0A1I6YUZ1_9FLAO|nr:MepB family protein [Lishizhenia tianjinensis]SFT54282.1 hypothetical protein SAMN05216474_1205 [Lishizhenia tianjinensis]
MISSFKLIFNNLNNYVEETESKEYWSSRFEVNQTHFLGRKSKKTPTKKGEFVTLWKRVQGKTHPFEQKDKLDFVVILNQEESGYFLFSKSVLTEKGIIQSSGTKGKCGFRLYFPHEKELNKQASKTQLWQKDYYHSLP